MCIVVKRDGRKESFDINKIIKAIERSFSDVNINDKSKAEEFAKEVAGILDYTAPLYTDEIQIKVEIVLANAKSRACEAFHDYRAQRTRIRNERDKGLSKTLIDIAHKPASPLLDYKAAGVDVEAGYKAVELMKKHVKRTYDSNVMGDLGSFGGFYSIADDKSKEPVLVAGTDGVGTKLKLAFALNKHDTIGIDCVAMCVNDIVCQGAKPLFFLDYLATGKLEPVQVEQIVAGIAEGCVQSGCALIGGETAEMPGFYGAGEYDLAGFAVGIVDRPKVINGNKIKAGDTLIGLASSGVHSNGFSLIRKLFGDTKTELEKNNIGQMLLTPTRLYVKTILSLIEKYDIKGVAHITGGGFIENIPRIFPKGIGGEVDVNSYPKSVLFELITEKSRLSNDKLYNTFNMGIGMVLCVDSKDTDKVIASAEELGEKAYLIGKTVKGEGLKLL